MLYALSLFFAQETKKHRQGNSPVLLDYNETIYTVHLTLINAIQALPLPVSSS